MFAPFAALEARTNVVVVARLSNAVALVNGVDVPVMFDKPYAGAFGGEADAVAPELTGPAWGLAALQRDDPLSVSGIAYEVETAEPDGHGFVRVMLRVV